MAGIASSSEFAARADKLVGTTDQSFNFVQALYLLLLKRKGSSAEVNSWLVLLPTLGKFGVAQEILASTEYRGDTVQGYYASLLHRTGSAQEVTSWVTSSLDLYSIKIAFYSSPEFFSSE